MKRRRFLTQTAKYMAAGITGSTLTGFASERPAPVWHIEQFEDKSLSQYTYALRYDNKIILIDPARDASPFYKYAKDNGAEIVAVIETHPHADFISAHADIQRNSKAIIYASRRQQAKYPHHPVDHGDKIELNPTLKLKFWDTPGHSPDSISIILEEDGKDKAVFTGDALLFGNVGRPDLREYAGSVDSQRNTLARQMYQTIHKKYATLSDDVLVYPAHGAGSLCGGPTRKVNSSTIGEERAGNFAFKDVPEDAFVTTLLHDLGFIPKYFPYDVELNRNGPDDLAKTLAAISILPDNHEPGNSALVVDTRLPEIIKDSFYPNAINVSGNGKFETWLGAVIGPKQSFYLIVSNPEEQKTYAARLAKIGYESNTKGIFIYNKKYPSPYPAFDDTAFNANPGQYTIVDVRTPHEFETETIFPNALNIPLPDLSKHLDEIPTDKPVLVVCASGYRSAIATSIIRKEKQNIKATDLGKAVTKYKK